ncbi:MAG: helix-turn-helix domain-containing protein [Candidatus Micrarchaeota archaeon]|nr:helix-turn-helix domain-containing protein [Candidatus Micrarchaeota archaeon]
MWTAKLKLFHRDCPIVTRCVKFGVSVLSYPRSHYVKKGKKYATTVCKFVGYEQEKKKQFIEDLKKDRSISRLDVSGDIFVYEYDLGKEGEHVMLYFDPEMVFVKPTINSPDGHEYWEVASWNKEKITKFIEQLTKSMDSSEVLGIGQMNNVDVYFPSVMPKLSPAQEKAIMLAYQWNYYEYPRKIDLRELAKIAKVSLSTYQENLRRAEAKMLPLLIERIVK